MVSSAIVNAKKEENAPDIYPDNEGTGGRAPSSISSVQCECCERLRRCARFQILDIEKKCEQSKCDESETYRPQSTDTHVEETKSRKHEVRSCCRLVKLCVDGGVLPSFAPCSYRMPLIRPAPRVKFIHAGDVSKNTTGIWLAG
jgi:hypothetical protein